MKKFAIAANPQKQEALELTCSLVDYLVSKSIKPVLIGDLANIICKDKYGADDSSIVGSDLLLILGGDGTLLHYSRLAVPHNVPMLAVNFGQYGFITEIQPEHIIPALEKVILGGVM
ncbi:MAG: NAD(+)/NADH kinase, partial [Armatimonadota bacterium]